MDIRIRETRPLNVVRSDTRLSTFSVATSPEIEVIVHKHHGPGRP